MMKNDVHEVIDIYETQVSNCLYVICYGYLTLKFHREAAKLNCPL
jgi:hypothetical protein